MAHHVEPMDLDSIDSDFDNKENSFLHNNVLQCTEKGYEELDVSELNMKLRYSITPVASPMSKSYTLCDNRNYDSEDSLNCTLTEGNNLTRSFNSTLTKNDCVKVKSLPLQSLPKDQFVDGNRNVPEVHQLGSNEKTGIIIPVVSSNDVENLSLPSSSSSTLQTPEATTPTKEISKDGGSPIMRGLKSVLNMFRGSTSPIPPLEVESSIPNNPEVNAEDISVKKEIAVSTPIALHRNKESSSKRNSPLKESIVFNDEIEKELQWKDETTILFSHEKIPIHKLFFQQSKPSKDEHKTNDEGNLNSTIEYMDVSYNNSQIDKNLNEISIKNEFVESDGEFVDCETTFTKTELPAEDIDKQNVIPLNKDLVVSKNNTMEQLVKEASRLMLNITVPIDSENANMNDVLDYSEKNNSNENQRAEIKEIPLSMEVPLLTVTQELNNTISTNINQIVSEPISVTLNIQNDSITEVSLDSIEAHSNYNKKQSDETTMPVTIPVDLRVSVIEINNKKFDSNKSVQHLDVVSPIVSNSNPDSLATNYELDSLEANVRVPYAQNITNLSNTIEVKSDFKAKSEVLSGPDSIVVPEFARAISEAACDRLTANAELETNPINELPVDIPLPDDEEFGKLLDLNDIGNELSLKEITTDVVDSAQLSISCTNIETETELKGISDENKNTQVNTDILEVDTALDLVTAMTLNQSDLSQILNDIENILNSDTAPITDYKELENNQSLIDSKSNNITTEINKSATQFETLPDILSHTNTTLNCETIDVNVKDVVINHIFSEKETQMKTSDIIETEPLLLNSQLPMENMETLKVFENIDDTKINLVTTEQVDLSENECVAGNKKSNDVSDKFIHSNYETAKDIGINYEDSSRNISNENNVVINDKTENLNIINKEIITNRQEINTLPETKCETVGTVNSNVEPVNLSKTSAINKIDAPLNDTISLNYDIATMCKLPIKEIDLNTDRREVNIISEIDEKGKIDVLDSVINSKNQQNIKDCSNYFNDDVLCVSRDFEIAKKSDEIVEKNLNKPNSSANLCNEQVDMQMADVDEEITISENNSPYVSIADNLNIMSVAEPLTVMEQIENVETKNEDNNSSPTSPAIVSKGYNFDFDEIDDPFATKTKIRETPPRESLSKSDQPQQIYKEKSMPKIDLVKKNKRLSQHGNKTPVTKKKFNATFDYIGDSKLPMKNASGDIIATDSKTEESLQIFTQDKVKDDIICIPTNKMCIEKSNSDVISTDNHNYLEQEMVESNLNGEDINELESEETTLDFRTSSFEQSTYCTAGTSSNEIIKSRNVFNIPEIDDINFNPFATKTKIRKSLSPQKDINIPFIATNVSSTINLTEAKVVGDKMDTELMEKDSVTNISVASSSSKSTDEKDNTVCEVHTEDEDTEEGPFLEADDDLDKASSCEEENGDMMQFPDSSNQSRQGAEAGEFFIDAEAFEFLLNQNKSNVVADSGKESLFLKFDPLFAKRMSSDGVFAALSKIQKRQNTPSKLSINTKSTTKSTTMSGEPNLNTTYDSVMKMDEANDDGQNTLISKPMMAVTPAVNPVPLPRKSITPNRVSRRSFTFTSPAMAVIDRLLSLSANSSLIDQEAASQISQEQHEADQALTQLREMLAEKEIDVYNLRIESKELRDRLSTLETQMKSLETESQERLKKVNDLNEKLAEKTKINKSMAAVVEEYERTIASLIAETELDKKRHAEERMKLINERDEQTAHLASMEVSFSDLHSKYEKSKQVILACKANEDIYKKSIKEFEETVTKMQKNYELLKQHATSKLNHANLELEKMNRAHESEVLKLNAMIKRKELHITSLEETLIQKTKANEELTAICDELINKVG